MRSNRDSLKLILNLGAGGMAQWLGAFAALMEDSDLTPSIHGDSQAAVTPIPEDLNSLWAFVATTHTWCTDIHKRKTCIRVK